jgi:hypothetical protein
MRRIKFNVNGTTYLTWNNASRVTMPSLILNDNGTIKYTPLFAVNNGAEATLDNHWYYRCGALAITHNNTKYHVAISRRYTNVLSGTISTTITHSGKTGTTTTTSKTVTLSGKHDFGTQIIFPGSQIVYANVTVNYGVTFLQTPAIYIKYGGTLVSAGTSSCVISVSTSCVNTGTSPSDMRIGICPYLLMVTGNVATTTTTTYPDETKSAVAQGNFNYGVTYPSVPNLWTDGSGIDVYNNNGNASCHVSKTLSGTVAFGKSATLSHNFAVGFNGDFGLG